MQSLQEYSTAKPLTMSPSIVELLNEAAVLPAKRDGSVDIISSSDLQVDDSLPILGAGSFAICVLAMKDGTTPCVVKIQRSLDYDHFDRELKGMLKCNKYKNSRMVELRAVCMPPPGKMSVPRLVMPLVAGMVLGKWLHGGGKNDKQSILCIARQLVDAVRHLHDVVGIVHGDLSMKNIMVDVEENRLVLIDFGNSRSVRKDKLRRWAHGNYSLSPPEALCGRCCDLVLAEVHVVGVLLICIDLGRMNGLCECPLPFKEGEDRDDECAVACLVRFWGRAQLFPYWSEMLEKAGERIDCIAGNASANVTDRVGRVGLKLAHPIPSSRQSLSDAFRHLKPT